jgi:hypothetical protein
MIWDDVKPWAEPPQEITAVLERVGGRNPFRKPNFRLVLAQGVFKLRGGLWHKWRDGATLQARGGMFVNEDGVRVQQSAEKPISVTAEMRWVKTYPQKDMMGWILEEWHPAHKFGAPEEWGSQKVLGTNLCQLGPYPQYGRYMLALPCAYPCMPTHHVLRTAVNYVNRYREFWAQLSPANRRRLEEDTDLARAAMIEKADNDRKTAMIKDAMSPMFSNTLEAGRWRGELAEAAHVRSHVGN